MSRKKLALCVVACLVLPFSAQAEKRDRTVDEMNRSIHEKAQRLDANGDGVLSQDETSKGRSKLGFLFEAASDAVDENSDGVLTVKEYEIAQSREVSLADKNRDGVLTVSEQKAQQRALIQRLLTQ